MSDASSQAGTPPNRCANVLPVVHSGNLVIGVSNEGERVVLRLDGELDLASVPTLESAMTDATVDGMAEILLDLRGLEFIDSTGLRAILLQDKRSTERGQTFALVRGPEQVQRLLDMTHVNEHLTIVASPEGDPPLACSPSTGGGGGGSRAQGRPAALGRPRVHLRETGSTNDRARELALAGAPHGTLVTAAAQSAGRGRQGRRWSAPAGSALLMSLLLRSPPPLLPLIAAVAVCDIAGEETKIKWPNDIVLACDPPPEVDVGTGAGDDARAGEGAVGPWRRELTGDGIPEAKPGPPAGGAPTLTRPGPPEAKPGPPEAKPGPAADGAPTPAKLAGILAEAQPQAGWAVLGIGLNVAVRLEELPLELRPVAATLGLGPDAIEPTLERLLTALALRLEAPTAETLDAWRARDVLYGREIAWSPRGDERGNGRARGRAQGIDGVGRLIVALDGGGHTTLDAGEVHLEPAA